MTSPADLAAVTKNVYGGGTYTKPADIADAPGKCRYDKTDPYGGTFRAYLAQDWPESLVGKVVGVSVDTNGKVVIGDGTDQGLTATTSGIVGLVVLTQAHKVSEGQIDVMRFGCIVGFSPTKFDTSKAATVAGGANEPGFAGTKYYVDAVHGIVSSTATGNAFVGATVGSDRLEVSVQYA